MRFGTSALQPSQRGAFGRALTRGDFRPVRIEHRQTIQKNDGTGQVRTVDWPLFSKARAALIPLRSSERFVADQFDAKVSVMYQLKHHVPGVAHDMRLVDESTDDIYNITGIRPSPERGAGQLLECFEYAD